MKKILTRLVIFLLIIAISDRLIGYFISEMIFSKVISGEGNGTINYLLQKKKNIDFIVMGSSRAKFQINPALMKDLYNANGYNIGNSGVGGTVYNKLLLNLLIDKGIVPKLVILQTDPYPYFTTNDENIKPEVAALYPFMNEDDRFKQLIEANTDYAEKVKLLFHLYRYNGKFFSIFNHYLKRKMVKENCGFDSVTAKMDTTRFAIRNNVNEKHNFSKVKMQAMKEIIRTCKENNIRLVVLFPPSYRNTLFSKACNDSIIHFLQDENIHDILNFTDIQKIPSLQPATLWKNATHLNNEGATVFSLLLNDTLKRLH